MFKKFIIILSLLLMTGCSHTESKKKETINHFYEAIKQDNINQALQYIDKHLYDSMKNNLELSKKIKSISIENKKETFNNKEYFKVKLNVDKNIKYSFYPEDYFYRYFYVDDTYIIKDIYA